jgi:hypothetical protein
VSTCTYPFGEKKMTTALTAALLFCTEFSGYHALIRWSAFDDGWLSESSYTVRTTMNGHDYRSQLKESHEH